MCKKDRKGRKVKDRDKKKSRLQGGRQDDRGTNQSPRNIKGAAAYSPALHCSTIGASGLNFSVRNGKRWDTAAIATRYGADRMTHKARERGQGGGRDCGRCIPHGNNGAKFKRRSSRRIRAISSARL